MTPSTRALATLACALFLTGCGGSEGLTGRVLAVDDTGGDPTAVGGGWIAVLTPEQFTTLTSLAGIDPPDEGTLPYLTSRVRHEAVGEAGGTLHPVDDDGEFSVGPVVGQRYVCLVRSLPDVDALRGCDAVDLPKDSAVEVTVGEGGLHVVLPD